MISVIQAMACRDQTYTSILTLFLPGFLLMVPASRCVMVHTCMKSVNCWLIICQISSKYHVVSTKGITSLKESVSDIRLSGQIAESLVCGQIVWSRHSAGGDISQCPVCSQRGGSSQTNSKVIKWHKLYKLYQSKLKQRNVHIKYTNTLQTFNPIDHT